MREVRMAVEFQLSQIAKSHNFNSLEKIKDNFVIVAEDF